MIDKSKILRLLGSGLSAEIVANAVGCDPSYISQLLADDEFRNQVSEERIKSLTSATARDEKYDTLEDRLLQKLSDTLDFFIKPRDVLFALATVNRMERRGTRPQESTVINNKIVNLVLPQRVSNQFIVNSGQQIVGISTDSGVKSLVTLDSKYVNNLAQQTLHNEPQERSESDENPRLTSSNSDPPGGDRVRSRDITAGTEELFDSEELLLQKLS